MFFITIFSVLWYKYFYAWGDRILNIFETKWNISLHLIVPIQEYKKAQEFFLNGTLSFASDRYFPGWLLEYKIDGHRWHCKDVEWRPGGQSQRSLPVIYEKVGKKYFTPESYKLKFSTKCLWVKKLKLEYFSEKSTLQKNLFVRNLYENLWLLTPRISTWFLSVSTEGVNASHGIYSFDESLDDDFLERVMPFWEDKWWLFRVNNLGVKAGFLSPLSKEKVAE
jgi:hypothetical protein